MNENPVYKDPLSKHIVSSNQNKGRQYHICFGEVDWGKNGETEYAVYVRICLFKEGIWQYQNYPAHILVTPGEDERSDLDNVMDKINELKREYL
ncbi:hypothetical protein [Salsuginibacillus kocurii]|uniref:hypothetical protein n=1 Tax=Salsuginibacillus kocurii TaxID=427078 RepID=UPI0003827D1F|nr:hypothetical protein [Salsuginibacillus kocurii]